MNTNLYGSDRVTPANIIKLEKNDVFVFGSNESGRHGLGAAKTAMQWGAKYGQAEGLQGQTYGIPTVNAAVTNKISVGKLRDYVETFIIFAKKNKGLRFLVTEIGCGLAGFKVADVAPLFKDAVELRNVCLPETFWKTLY